MLVIDDYQNIEAPGINGFFEQLAESEPELLHVVLVTRNAKFARLHELTLKGILLHIPRQTLELAPKEITAYYRLCGVAINERDASRLRADTEGWISALYLIMLEYILKGEYASTEGINTLIERAVFIPLPAHIRDFLVQMSMFDAFTLEQAAYIWGESAGDILERLTESNSFVTCDSRLKVYHIHNLFLDFLRGKLGEKDAACRKALSAKAARWSMENKDYAFFCIEFSNQSYR